MQAPTIPEVWFWVFSVLCAGFGAYLGAYLKKKGENLATHEDIDRLVEQTAKLTKTTKEIEAKISGDLWSQQKQWELKRDVLFEVGKKVGNAIQALAAMCGIYSAFPEGEQLVRKGDAQSKWADALGDLYGASVMVGLVCGSNVREEIRDFHIFLGKIANEIPNEPDIFNQSAVAIAEKLADITREIRREIEVDRPL